MIEPIGWLRTLQFVATDACVTPRCRGRGSSSSFSREKQTHVWEDECVRAPLLFLYNVLLNSEYKFLWVARWCVREVPRDRFNASEKNTSLELATRLFLSNAPLTIRYVYDGASYCTYTAVEKEVPWHMLHHGREHVPTLRHLGIVPHFETRTVNKFWACVSSHSKLLPCYI